MPLRKAVFRSVRYSLYLAFVLNAAMVQWLVPVHYRCELEGRRCFACGLRTALDLALRGQPAQAVRSNPLILVFALLALAMAVDVGSFLWKRLTARRPGRGGSPDCCGPVEAGFATDMEGKKDT